MTNSNPGNLNRINLSFGEFSFSFRYWNNPDILTKFSEAVQDVMGEEGGDPPGGEDGEAAEGPPSMQQYAGEGNTNR